MSNILRSVAVAGSIILLGLFVVAAIYGGMPASEFHEVENETIVADVGNVTPVEEQYGSFYYDNATVDDPDGNTMVEGDDYEWYPSNATVYWYDSPEYNDSDDMVITYSFDAKPERARTSIGVVASSFRLGALIMIVLTAGLVIGAVAGLEQTGRGGRL